MKKAVYALVFLFCMSTVLGAIEDNLKLSQTRVYHTPSANFTISWEEYDLLNDRLLITINGKKSFLNVLQVENSTGYPFQIQAIRGASVTDAFIEFRIGDVDVYSCESGCLNNTLIDIAKEFDDDFELCEKECVSGCDLFREVRCVGNNEVVFDNCNMQREMLGRCEPKALSPHLECLSDEECEFPEQCYFGECKIDGFVVGDGLCSLPQESCSSRDCTCSSKPKVSNEKYPIILLHGFASSPRKLIPLQKWLARDLEFENGGEIRLNEECPSNSKDIVYRASFYTESYGDSLRLPVLVNKAYAEIPGQKGRDATYTSVLAAVVSKVKQCTGSRKVHIIGHSMGGIVTRSYLLEGSFSKNVEKVILLATPNAGGVYGEQTYKLFTGLNAELGDRKTLLQECSTVGIPSIALTLIDGRDYSGECEQLQQARIFSSKAVEIDPTPGLTQYYTIAGSIDELGDGTVTLESAQLKGAIENTVVECDHFDLKNPGRCQDAYNAILKALGEDYSKYEVSWWKRIWTILSDEITMLTSR